MGKDWASSNVYEIQGSKTKLISRTKTCFKVLHLKKLRIPVKGNTVCFIVNFLNFNDKTIQTAISNAANRF